MDNRVKLGLVGLNFGGHIAEREIFSGIGLDYVEISGICDLNHIKAEEFGAKHHIKVFPSLDTMLKDQEIEAIGLFTPPAGRAELIRKCIKAHKHVITTKPFELDPDNALKVLHEARNAGIAIHLNSPCPLPAQDMAKIAEWQEKYSLGQPIAARWETYGNYNECPDGTWLDSPEYCPVAPIFRLGIYGINELLELMGDVEAVQVSKSRIFTGRPTPDNAELTMTFANGAIGSVFASLCINDGFTYPGRLIIHYENGTIFKHQRKDATVERNADFKAVDMILNCVFGGDCFEEQFTFSPENRSGAYQWKVFYDAVRNGKPLMGERSPEKIVSGIAVISAMAIAEKTNVSEKVKKWCHKEFCMI